MLIQYSLSTDLVTLKSSCLRFPAGALEPGKLRPDFFHLFPHCRLNETDDKDGNYPEDLWGKTGTFIDGHGQLDQKFETGEKWADGWYI